MKRILIILVMLASAAYAITETHFEGDGSSAPRYTSLKKVVIGALTETAGFNSATRTTRQIFGIFHRIVIDQTGSDASYNVRVQDENLFDIFNATLTDDVDYAALLSASSTSGTDLYAGIPVCGTLTVKVRGAASSTLTGLKVILYYTEYWK
ncbi:MAG TPA: hypothetical protein ENH60_03350 [Pricia sp.]|nr:hypothetical protein [Pricia sp.]